MEMMIILPIQRVNGPLVYYTYIFTWPNVQMCAYVCVSKEQLLLSAQFGGGIDLGLTTDRIFKEHPQPLSAIAEENQPV